MGPSGGGETIATSEPVIGALRYQTSAYGMPIPLIYGMTRVQGNLLWYGDFTAIPHTTTTSSGGGGGKGGGGESSTSNTSYTYTTSFMLGLGEGPLTAVESGWKDKAQFADPTLLFSEFLGTYPTQSPWSYLTTYHAAEAIGYQGLAYVAAANYDLGNSAELPNHTFEVIGSLPFNAGAGIYDANVRDVVVDYLTNAHYGTGFPSSKLGDYTQFSNWCIANGIFISPAYAEQTAANETITALAVIANAAPFYSEGKLKIVPYGDAPATGNGVTFTPNLTPEYDLTDDDFMGNGEDPVTCERSTPADAFNCVSIEFYDRDNQYNVATVEAKDQANIEIFGLRKKDPIKMHEICDAAVAQIVAQIVLQRCLYVRNVFSFQLGWNKSRLEPMDIVTLTDPGLGLSRTPVRITEIDEDEDGLLSIKAEEMLIGTASAAVYSTQAGSGYSVNYNAAPGNINAPVLFEPPVGLTSGNLEVWAAVSGGALWGGCEVWVSDDGSAYQRAGRVDGPARHGTTTATLPLVADPDTTSTLNVDLSLSRAQLLSATQAQADVLDTLCWVDGELIAYQTAALTAQYKYGLSYLRRGQYGTAVAAHNSGSQFARLDGGIGKFPFSTARINKPAYVKFPSFNIYGGGMQNLADVPAYTYNISGAALKAALANVLNLVNVFRAGLTVLAWDDVTDPVRTVDYEIRKGATWATAQILGRTPSTEFPADGDGTYWVSAHSDLAYSATPTSIVIAGSTLTKNVVATFDEQATGWLGTESGGASVLGSSIVLAGGGLFSAIPVMSAAPDIYYYGGVAASGCYTIPAGHEVDVGSVQACNCSVSYVMRADNPFALFSALPDVAAAASVGGNFSGLADAKVQIATADVSGTYGAWRDFVPGSYLGRKFKFRVNLYSYDPSVLAALDNFAFTVDVPDRLEKGTSISVSALGIAVTYATPFQVPPNVQITILSASQNDDAVLTLQTVNGFSVQILNGGAGVARTINWLAQGY